MYYRHELNYKYPERSDQHMIASKRKRELTFDESYPYLNKSRGFKILRILFWVLLTLIIFPVTRVSHGLRIYGKKNLKKHKKALKNGAITVSNHVFYWDYLCVLKAIRPHLAYYPAWKDNLEGSCGKLIRLSGGIPIPTESMRAMRKFNEAMEEVLKSGKWLHFFPEGSMWLFYPDIRPLKRAVFDYSVKFQKPIIPISMSFRPRRGIMKLFSKKPLVDLHIAEPLFPSSELPPREEAEKLRRDTYRIMQIMNGIVETAPNYNTNQSIDDYKSTM